MGTKTIPRDEREERVFISAFASFARPILHFASGFGSGFILFCGQNGLRKASVKS